MKDTNDTEHVNFTNWFVECMQSSEKFHQAAQEVDWSKFDINKGENFSKFLGVTESEEQAK